MELEGKTTGVRILDPWCVAKANVSESELASTHAATYTHTHTHTQ